MTRESFEEQIGIIFEEVGVEVINENECEADSFTYMSLITAIEEEFDIELPDEFLVMDSLKNITLFKSLIYDLI